MNFRNCNGVYSKTSIGLRANADNEHEGVRCICNNKKLNDKKNTYKFFNSLIRWRQKSSKQVISQLLIRDRAKYQCNGTDYFILILQGQLRLFQSLTAKTVDNYYTRNIHVQLHKAGVYV